MTDRDYLLHVLRDGDEHELSAIIRRSQDERGHGFTVHSRAAELRKHGHEIRQRSEIRNGRRLSFYRFVGTLEKEAQSTRAGDCASSSSVTLDTPGADGSPGFAGRHGLAGDPSATFTVRVHETPPCEIPLKPGFAPRDSATDDTRDGVGAVTGAKPGSPSQLSFLDAPKRGAYSEAA